MKLGRKVGKYRLTFPQHIFEDNIDAAVVGVVVAPLQQIAFTIALLHLSRAHWHCPTSLKASFSTDV